MRYLTFWCFQDKKLRGKNVGIMKCNKHSYFWEWSGPWESTTIKSGSTVIPSTIINQGSIYNSKAKCIIWAYHIWNKMGITLGETLSYMNFHTVQMRLVFIQTGIVIANKFCSWWKRCISSPLDALYRWNKQKFRSCMNFKWTFPMCWFSQTALLIEISQKLFGGQWSDNCHSGHMLKLVMSQTWLQCQYVLHCYTLSISILFIFYLSQTGPWVLRL